MAEHKVCSPDGRNTRTETTLAAMRCLADLVAKHGVEYIEQYFQYSILDIFDPRVPDRTVIEREHWWMDALSSVRDDRASSPHGYNSKLQWNRTSEGREAGLS